VTDRVGFDLQDRAALRALDSDFVIAADGEVATIADTRIEIVRGTDDRYRLTITFSGGEKFLILLSRDQTLKQLGIREEVPEQ
jgi:hypothetical protein